MEFRQLRYFLRVVKYGSINRAAASLNVTQPSLSHSIKALERSVGTQLLIRSGGGIRLTAIGEVFERYAQNILRESEKALSEVSSLRGGGRGKISVGIMSVFSLGFGSRVISKFVQSNKDTDVDAFSFTSNSEFVIKQIQSAEWDLALTLAGDQFDMPSDIAVRNLGALCSNVYCNANHPLASAPHVTLEDMAPYTWAVTNVGLSERHLRSVFGAVGLEPDIRVRTNSINQVVSLAYDHPFLCLLPDNTVQEDVLSGKIVKINQDLIYTKADIAVVYSNLSERTSGMKTFIRLCAEEAAHSCGPVDETEASGPFDASLSQIRRPPIREGADRISLQ